jgi:hypothetical protein
MRAEHVDRLTDTLSNLPTKIGAPILTAWNAKEDLLDLLALARTQPDRETIARLLHRFYTRCANSSLPELHRLATTINTWTGCCLIGRRRLHSSRVLCRKAWRCLEEEVPRDGCGAPLHV